MAAMKKGQLTEAECLCDCVCVYVIASGPAVNSAKSSASGTVSSLSAMPSQSVVS